MTTLGRAKTYCDMPFTSLYILEDGSIYPCCFAPGHFAPFGNANTDDIERVWQTGMERLRQQMLTGNVPDPCRDCLMGTYHQQPVPASDQPTLAAPPPTHSIQVNRENWLFSTPEREFLRLCAEIKPDWAAMIQIARTALHYGELRKLAGLHQLHGVVAWRLRADELDGVVPEIVRDDCQRQLDWLRLGGDTWHSDIQSFLDDIESSDIAYVITGSPVVFALYPGLFWARDYQHADMIVHPRDSDRIIGWATDRGVDLSTMDSSWPQIKIRCSGGTEIKLAVLTPADSLGDDYYLRNDRLFEGRRRAKLLSGVDAYVPDPSKHCAVLIEDMFTGLVWDGDWLTLQNLARLHNIMALPDFSPAVFFQHLGVTQTGSRQVTVRVAIERLAQYDKLEAKFQPLRTWAMRGSEAVRCCWMARLAAKVYPVNQEVLDTAEALLADYEPSFVVPWPSENNTTECEWADIPPVEQWLFEMNDNASPADRFEAGFYRSLQAYEHVGTLLRDAMKILDQHPVEKGDA